MPSDERIEVALRALERPIGDFRLTIDGALGQAEQYLADQATDPVVRAERARQELGVFGAARMDSAAFAALFAARANTAGVDLERFRSAVATLRDVLERGPSLFVLQVPPGGSLGLAVEAALARIGRAFGAVLAVELLRSGSFVPAEHDALLAGLPFRSWTRTERRYAPPLVVQVAGTDCHVGALADYLDGRQRIVLVVTGATPPAPLVRLITPGTLVLQTSDGTGLDAIAGCDAPSIAALVPPEAARFLHDPRGGREPWQRLSIWHMPEAPRHAISGFSAWQMAEDLRQLAALAAAPAESALPGTGAGAPSVDTLANWLLARGNFEGIA